MHRSDDVHRSEPGKCRPAPASALMLSLCPACILPPGTEGPGLSGVQFQPEVPPEASRYIIP